MRRMGVTLDELIGLLAIATCNLRRKWFAVLPEFSFTARDLASLHVVALHGELDVASADGLHSLAELAGSFLVFDLSDLTFIDSSGIGALLMARNRILAEARGDLVVTSPTAPVRRTLEIVGLDEWIVDWSPDWNA